MLLCPILSTIAVAHSGTPSENLTISGPYTFGDLGRNSLRPDWFRNLDCSLFRKFPVREGVALTLRLEAFNVFNNVAFAAFGNVINGPNLGVVTSTANSPRQVQAALKLVS